MQIIADWFARATFPDYMGMMGFIGYISAYFLLQVGILKSGGYTFSIMNLVASACILVSLSKDFNPYFAITEILWSLLSIVGIARVFYVQNFVRFSPFEASAITILAPNLPKDLARKLLAIARRGTIEKGSVVVNEGEKADNLIVLLDGICSVLKDGVEVASLRTGAIIGEMTYATGAPATATVRATADCDAYLFPAERLRELLAANPLIASQLELTSAVAMRQRLKDTTAHVAGTQRQA